MNVHMVVFRWPYAVEVCRYLSVTCISLFPGVPLSFVNLWEEENSITSVSSPSGNFTEENFMGKFLTENSISLIGIDLFVLSVITFFFKKTFTSVESVMIFFL